MFPCVVKRQMFQAKASMSKKLLRRNTSLERPAVDVLRLESRPKAAE